MQVGYSITSLECSKDAGILDRIRGPEVADLEGHLHGWSLFVSTKLNPNLPRGITPLCNVRRPSLVSLRKVFCVILYLIQRWMDKYLSLVPRLLQDFIHSCGENLGKGLGSLLRHGLEMVDWVSTESTISGLWRGNVPRPSPNFSSRLRDKIWECSRDEVTNTCRSVPGAGKSSQKGLEHTLVEQVRALHRNSPLEMKKGQLQMQDCYQPAPLTGPFASSH